MAFSLVNKLLAFNAGALPQVGQRHVAGGHAARAFLAAKGDDLQAFGDAERAGAGQHRAAVGTLAGGIAQEPRQA